MIKDVARLECESNVGVLSTMIQLLLYEKTIIPSITYNLEGITYWRKSDTNELEKYKENFLKQY